MECREAVVSYLSWGLVVGGGAYLLRQMQNCAEYGRYAPTQAHCCPARLGWFLQEVPALFVPLLLLLLPAEAGSGTGRRLLVGTFMLHYFHRSIIYALLTRGRPIPLIIIVSAVIFCSINGFLQGHFLLHCARFEDTWLTRARLTAGGMFEFVSGANFFGEIVEWCGYAVAVWSLPAFAFAFFTICSIGPRACMHHRDYQQRFKDYPRSRKAIIPFIL